MIREQVLKALEENRGVQISGGMLAQQLGVSRAAVWKAVQTLRDQGIHIEAAPGGGYRLPANADTLNPAAVRSGLASHAFGRELIIVDETVSTNTLMKQEFSHKPHGFTLIAKTQTGARGRFGRSFFCRDGQGLYLSVLLRPSLPASSLNFITVAAAVAVCRAITRTTGLTPEIKWVNDILYQGKKLCGVLTEASIEGETGAVDYVVLGIGINLCINRAELPDALSDIVGSLSDFCEAVPRRATLAGALLDELAGVYQLLAEGKTTALLEAYRALLGMLGKRVTVLQPSGAFPAVAAALDDNGHLVVTLEDGSVRTLSSGEISIRL